MTKRIAISELTSLTVAKMVRAWVSLEEAEVAAPIYVEGDLCGRPSHGVRHLYNNFEQFRLGEAEHIESFIADLAG